MEQSNTINIVFFFYLWYNLYMIKKILNENKYLFIILIIVIALLSIIMRSSIHEKIMMFDSKVIFFISNLIDIRLTNLFKYMTNFGDIYIPFLILVCIFVFIKNKWYFYLQSGTYLFAGIITYISKLIVSRPRPVSALIDIPKSFSFPSGHTLTSFVFYSFLCYLLTINIPKKYKPIFYIFYGIMILIIAMSRIYLGVHYFSDVIGGFIIGIICLIICINITEKNFKERLKWED